MYNFTFLQCLQMEAKETHQGRKCASLKPDPCLKELTAYTVDLAGSKGYNLPQDLGKGIKPRSLEREFYIFGMYFPILTGTAQIHCQKYTRAAKVFIHSENTSKIEKLVS